MKTYITQLLADIQSAHRPDSVDNHVEAPVTFEEEMEVVDNYTSGTNIPPSLSLQCGLSKEQFPPTDKLTDTEVHTIIDAFQEMLSTWHINADFPSGVPDDRAYPLLIGLLDEEAWYFPGGMLHFDFCTGYAPECELKEYCPCLEYWKT